jgi:hypothetical protein
MSETEEFLLDMLHVEPNLRGQKGSRKPDPQPENYPALWEVNKRCLAEFH